MENAPAINQKDLFQALKDCKEGKATIQSLKLIVSAFMPLLSHFTNIVSANVMANTIDYITISYARMCIENPDNIESSSSDRIWEMMELRDVLREIIVKME